MKKKWAHIHLNYTLSTIWKKKTKKKLILKGISRATDHANKTERWKKL